MPLTHRREKELASDRRAGWTARTSIRERHRQTVRTQWRLLAMLAAALLALFGVAAVFATGPLQRGLIVGAGVTLTACAVAALVVLTSGSAPLIMGELAEQWTAQELRPLREHGWKLVNHFGLGPGDQDHVVVGPGGVVLVETKWGGTPWDVDAGDVVFRRALQQTAGNARQLSLWHGVAKHGRPAVEPVLVVWGPAARELREHPAWRHDSGVVVMSGDHLRAWMLRRARDRLSTTQVEGVVGEIDRHLVRRDERERLLRPMPRSLADMATATVVGLGLATAAFVLSSWLLQLVESVLVWLAVGLALMGASELARRRSRWRWEARTFQFALRVVDDAWCAFTEQGRAYERFCDRAFGKYLPRASVAVTTDDMLLVHRLSRRVAKRMVPGASTGPRTLWSRLTRPGWARVTLAAPLPSLFAIDEVLRVERPYISTELRAEVEGRLSNRYPDRFYREAKADMINPWWA